MSPSVKTVFESFAHRWTRGAPSDVRSAPGGVCRGVTQRSSFGVDFDGLFVYNLVRLFLFCKPRGRDDRRTNQAGTYGRGAFATRGGEAGRAQPDGDLEVRTGRGNTNLEEPDRLARALDVRIEFFFRPDTVSLGKPKYRKRSKLSKKQLERIEADILEKAERFLEVLQLFPEPPVPSFSVPASVPARIDELEAVEDAALAVREAWHLGHNAIPCLADTLEERGLLVMTTDVEDEFDGLAAEVGGLPLVVVGASWPGERQRFTMAHELGHLVLDGRLAKGLDEEKACDRFAGAFLVPRDSALLELGRHRNAIELLELHVLKREYGLSMQAWIHRAREVGALEAAVAASLLGQFKARGWRVREPGDQLPPEPPCLFERLVARAHAEEMISPSKAAELMRLPLSQYNKQLRLEASRVTADR